MISEIENTLSSSEVSPNENDVVSGRGSGANKHKGNLHFRSMIRDNKTYYLSLSKNLKMGVARQIFDDITSLDPPGRFLQKNPETDTWFEIKSDRALEKISQALREKPHAKKLDHPNMHNEAIPMQPLNSNASDGLRRGSNNFDYPPQQRSSQQYVDMHQCPVPGPVPGSGSGPVTVLNRGQGQGQHSGMQMQMMGGPMQSSQRRSPMHNAIPMPMPPPASAPVSVRVVQSQPSSQYYEMRGASGNNTVYSQQQMPPQFQNQGPPSVVMQARSSFQQQQQQHYNKYPQNQQMQQPYHMQQGPAPYPNMNTVITKVVYTDAQGRVLQEGPPRPQMMPATFQTVYTENPSIPEVPREYLGDGRVSYMNAAAPQQGGPGYSHSPMRQEEGDINSRQHHHQHQQSYQHQQQHNIQSYSSHHQGQGQGQMHQPYTQSGMQQQYPHYARKKSVDLSRVSPTYGDDSRYMMRKSASTESPSYENAKKRGRSKYSLPLKTKAPLTLQTNTCNEGENKPVPPLVSPLNDDKKKLLSGAEEEEATEKDSTGLNTLSAAASMLSEQ